MRYVILDAETPDELEKAVGNMLDAGFEPMGGVAVCHYQWENERKGYTESDTTYYQAVYKATACQGQT